jgi:hypothetical protein
MTTLREKRRSTGTGFEDQPVGLDGRSGTDGASGVRAWMVVAVLLAVFAGIGLGVLLLPGGDEAGADNPAGPAVDEDEMLERLINEGYIPPAAGRDSAGTGRTTEDGGSSTYTGDWKDGVVEAR